MNPILQVEDLTYIYSIGTPFEHKALDQVSFSINPGEFVGIIGHTGSGKSTLMQQLNGLLKPTSGRVLLDGQDIWSDKKLTRAARFRVGLVFQYPEYQLFEETVYKDIAFGPTNMGLTKEEIDRRVREAAGFVGLTEKQLEVSPFDLSGGQKRRVAKCSSWTSHRPGWTLWAGRRSWATSGPIGQLRMRRCSWSATPWRMWPD